LLPGTAAFWIAGILAVCGSPPFALFVSEFSILEGLLRRSLPGAVCYLFLLGVVFIGMLIPVQRMYTGQIPPGMSRTERENASLLLPPACLIGIALLLGLYMPEWLNGLLRDAAPVR
jgi:hydrogenase-4 component F